MRINFRQGLVSSKVSSLGQPDYLTTNSQGVTVNGAETPLVFTICDGPKNYTISINASLVAWPVRLFDGVSEAWLYVEVNRATAAISYGITTVQPTYGPVAPTAPVDGAMWFNTTKLENFVFNSAVGRWLPTLRVLAGHYTTTTLNEVDFGTQIGLTGSSVTSGQIVSDGFGRAITDSSGRFFTTEDIVLIAGVESHAAKLESNVLVGSAAESIPAFHVVRFNAVGDVELADYDNVGDSVIGMSVVSGTIGNPINMVISGLVHNTAWNWPGPNRTLWVNQTGQLTMTDPYDLGGRSKRRVPVGRTVDKHTIIFDQGMGGVGEKGDDGDVDGIPIASNTTLGVTRLSVAPANAEQPIAVGDNDPRLTDPRVPLEHTHPATSVTVSPFGTFNGANAQQALEHIQTVKLNLSGGTVTGNITSTVTATQDTHLVTLGQAKSEITARAVTQRRHVLTDAASTIVQAFNALSPTNRTISVNTIVIVEWRGYAYMWAGGYGAPVGATDDAQFLLLGKLTGGDGNALTVRVVEAFTLYENAPPVLLISFASTELDLRSFTVDVETGEVVEITNIPPVSGYYSYFPEHSTLVMTGSDTVTGNEFIRVGTLSDTGEWIQRGTITEYTPGFTLGGVKRFALSGNGARLAFTHNGPTANDSFVTVVDSETLTPTLQLQYPETVSVINGNTEIAMNNDGSVIVVRYGTATATEEFGIRVYNQIGTQLRQYDSLKMSSVYGLSNNTQFVMAAYDYYGTEGTRLYLVDFDNLPATIPVLANCTLPQTTAIYGFLGDFVSNGEQIVIASGWDDVQNKTIHVSINLTTGTFSLVSSPSVEFPHIWNLQVSLTGDTMYATVLHSTIEGAGRIYSYDTETRTWGSEFATFTVPENASTNSPVLL